MDDSKYISKVSKKITDMDEIINSISKRSTSNKDAAKAMSEALHRVTKISERLSNEFAGFSF